MRVAIGSVMTIVCSLVFAVAAQAQLPNYDAFTGALDPALWNGIEDNTSALVISNTESQRAVVQPNPRVANRFLQLKLTTGHPGTGSDVGVAGEGRQRLRVVRDDILGGDPSVTALRTKITVTATKTPGCPTSADPLLLTNQNRSRAQLVGWFFNDGTSTGPGDATGDILVGINVEQRSADGRLIVAFMNRCTAANCSSTESVKSVVFTRTWALNTPVAVMIEWQRDNDQFVFTAGTESQTLTYSDVPLTDTAPPVLPLYDLRVANTIPHCSTPIRVPTTARFDFLQMTTEAQAVVFP